MWDDITYPFPSLKVQLLKFESRYCFLIQIKLDISFTNKCFYILCQIFVFATTGVVLLMQYQNEMQVTNQTVTGIEYWIIGLHMNYCSLNSEGVEP